ANVLSPSTQILNAQIQAVDKYGSPQTRRVAQDPYMKLEVPAEFKVKADGKVFTIDEVRVLYGFMTIENKFYDCRSYQAPIKDHEGNLTGYATVVLSEDQIVAKKWSLAGTVVILFVLFIGLGIGISILVGRKITEPVKALIEDVTIVAGGDLSHHSVPHSPDEIGLLARTFDKMTKNLQEASKKEAELVAQRHQLAIAQEVQSNLLPDKIPQVPGYEIEAFHRSSKQVDGNYYDVIEYPDGKVGALVAAASGKGIPAAMVMTMARSFFRALAGGAKDTVKMMRETNRLLSPDLRAGMYVEVLMVLIDPIKHKAKLVSAGPTSLLRFNYQQKKLQGIHAEGIALGFDKGPVFDKSLKEVEFDIAPGDRLVLNTPGLFSVKNREGVELGTLGFAKAVNKTALESSDVFVERVVSILDNYAGHAVHESDITFLTVKRKEA
ncbi:MAG: SpoIIE family protein phosphatase, partial [Planctomycetota bacterium]